MGELVWAVTDGPEGTAAVLLPADGDAARRLGQQARDGLWCARGAGGCGGRLEIVPGPRPAFRHTGAPCALARREDGAARAYDHLRYRPALTAWLTAQGHRPRVERSPDPDGHPGLHVVVAGTVLQVQLAPLTDTAWRERDDRLHREAAPVTWFYGPDAEAAAATEASVRGAGLLLRRHVRDLMVGVRDTDDATRWVRLAACRLTADGVTAPGLDEARDRFARRRTERQEAARRVARQAARWSQRSGAVPWDVRTGTLPFPAAG